MSFSIVEICAVSLLVGTGCIIYLERKFPYRRGIPFFREGFWTDLIGYGLIQSFFLKIVIFDYIIMPIQSSVSLDSIPNIGQWPLFLQVLFFVITGNEFIFKYTFICSESKSYGVDDIPTVKLSLLFRYPKC